MAKALVLSEEALAAPVSQPRAAQPAPVPVTRAKSSEAREAPKAPQVPFQIRIAAARRQGHQARRLGSRPDDQRIHACMLSCSA